MILDRILETKAREIAADKEHLPLEQLKQQLSSCQPTRGFADTLRSRALTGTAIIAEVKKGSPSKGIIRADFDPLAIACSYQAGGAACLSVLTDEQFFYGSLDYLRQIRQVVELPLLRKDFIIDPYQVYQARAAGADAILLIAAALDDEKLSELATLAAELKLDTLLEVHDGQELDRALKIPVDLIGINNRNLKNFVTDLSITEHLAGRIPAHQVAVSESGIHSRADIERLQAAGAGAFLVGESLMRENDIEAKLQSLVNSEAEGEGEDHANQDHPA